MMSGTPGRRLAAGMLLAALGLIAMVRAATLGDAVRVQARPFVGVVTRPAHGSYRMVETTPQPSPLAAAAAIPPGHSSVRVPILMYHYIRDNVDPHDRLGFNLSVTPADFAQQMDWLTANGYHPVDLEDLRAYLLGHEGLPSRPVVLTFDDGYRDMYTTAFPILLAHHFKAVAYIVSGFVGSSRNVTAEQIAEMDVNGIQIGAHTVSHADLTKISQADLSREVAESKASLEALTGHSVVDFCYPAGRYNDAVVRAVQDAGYQSATTTEPGMAHSTTDRFTWMRVRVNGGESLADFIGALGDPEPAIMVVPTKPPATPRGIQRKIKFPLRAPPAESAPGAPVEGPVP
jgi:peptidoglycan/xylan/chitin deacetylase (PgdA/CDA1 family)